MKSQIARKTGLKQSKHVAEWGKQNQQGGSKIFINLGEFATATIGGSLVNPESLNKLLLKQQTI